MPAPAQAIAVADAIVADLNGASLSLPVAAKRLYVPRFKLEELETLHCSVVPRGEEKDRSNRNMWQRDAEVEIGLHKRLAGKDEAEEIAELDALVFLAEEISAYYETRLPTGRPESLFAAAFT